MSRTYKDKPYKLSEFYSSWSQDREEFRYLENGFLFYGHIYKKTTKTKKRKEVDTEDHWMTAPGWWNRMVVTRPERKKVNSRLQSLPDDLEEVDIPDLGRKPKIYFW